MDINFATDFVVWPVPTGRKKRDRPVGTGPFTGENEGDEIVSVFREGRPPNTVKTTYHESSRLTGIGIRKIESRHR